MSSESTTSEIPDILSGNLDKVSLPNLLKSLQNSKKTGSLDISSKHESTIFFDQGYPYFAAGGSEETLLGKILLNKNKITKYQYDKAAEEIKKNKDKRIGEILVSLGMITPHELNDYLEMQLTEKILESFLYLEGSFEFKETKNIDNSIFYSKINTPELIHDGFQRFLKSTDIDLQVIEMDVTDNLTDKTDNLGLGPKELRLVQLISQDKSLSYIEKSKKFKKDEIVRVVLLLSLYDITSIKNFSVNDYLIDSFKNFRTMNPLPNVSQSNFNVKESELTDPTGEVLLLDEELEATAEREKLELKEKEETEEKQQEETVDTGNQEGETLEEATKDEAVEEPDSKEETIGIDEEAEDVDILESAENFNFQDTYEGDQHPIDINETKKKTETKAEDAKENDVVEISIDEIDEKQVMEELKNLDSDSDGPAVKEAVSEEGDINKEKINTEDTDTSLEIESEQEEEIKLDLDEIGEPQPETEEEKVEKELKVEPVVTEDQEEGTMDASVVKELNEFYDFIQDEDDYYKILRVDLDATSEEIKDGYYLLIKKFHPDANSNFPEEIRIKAEQIFTKVTKAYEVLLDEDKRIEYDKRDELNKLKDKANSIYEAELIYTEGEMLLRQRNYKEAEKKFFSAIELNPDESAYIGMYSWAKYLAAPDKERVIDDVKKELNRAIEMDPGVEQNYYYLGSIYKFTENFSRAEKNFAKAIEIDPNYIEAKRELRLITNRKTQKGKLKESDKKIEKKFWSGLFKK